MASTPGDRVELLAGILERQALSYWPVGDTRHNTRNDARLVEVARRGDRTAFGLLYELYAQMVHASVSNANFIFDSGPMSLNVGAGGTLIVRTTPGTGCSTQAANATIAVEYKMQ